MASEQVKFEGWGAFAPDSIKGNFKWFEYEPKTWCEDDIECKFGLVYYDLSQVDLLFSQDPVLRDLRFGPAHRLFRMGRHDRDVSASCRT